MAGSILRLRAAVAAVGRRQFASSSSSAWLMLPSHKMYSPGEEKVVNIKSSNILKDDDYEVVGSSRGWVGLFKEEYDQSCSSISSVSVWNPMSGDHINLPPLHTIPNDPSFGYLSVEKLIVDDAECSRVVIVGSSQWLGVCCPGRCREWTLFERDRQSDDVVSCSQKKFYTLHDSTCGGEESELVRWNISEARRPRMEWKSSLSELGYVIHEDGEDFPRKPKDRDYCYSFPHLVYAEHSDQLFIVTRHYIEQAAPDGSSFRDPKYYEIYPNMTVGFDVHLVESCCSAGKGKGKGKVRYMKHSLDGLVMFVGLNDSFAVPAADFPHLKPDSIYFTDRHEDAHYSQCLEDKVYGGHDVGIYNYKNEMVSSCYFPVDHHCFKRTNDPPPFWFTPTSIK